MILSIVLGLITVFIFGMLTSGIKLAVKLLINSLVGYVVLTILSAVGSPIPITFTTTLIVGLFGVPGVIGLLIGTFLNIF